MATGGEVIGRSVVLRALGDPAAEDVARVDCVERSARVGHALAAVGVLRLGRGAAGDERALVPVELVHEEAVHGVARGDDVHRRVLVAT